VFPSDWTIRDSCYEIEKIKIELSDSEKLTETENDKIYKKLSKLVNDHNFAIDLSKEMSSVFTGNILSHYLSASFVICICSLSILLAEGVDKGTFINYMMAANFQLLGYSIGGTLLSTSSQKVKNAIYDIPWYKCNRKVRKSIQMIIQRADRETGVQVPFFWANLETYRSVSVLLIIF
jgi:hypothetical protein